MNTPLDALNYFFFLICLHAKHTLLPFDLSTNRIFLQIEQRPIKSFIILTPASRGLIPVCGNRRNKLQNTLSITLFFIFKIALFPLFLFYL